MSEDLHVARTADEPAALVARMDALGREMAAHLDSLGEQDLLAARFVGEWSVSVLIAHLWRWTKAADEVIRDHLAGRTSTDYDDFEPWNQRWAAADATLAPAEARRRWQGAHEALRDLARSIPAEHWDAIVRGWIKGSGIHHLEAHLEDLRARAQG